MGKHGIFKNDKEKKYEAWFEGSRISTISYKCQEKNIAIWKERYSRYLGITLDA
jgi:hypothetical protein